MNVSENDEIVHIPLMYLPPDKIAEKGLVGYDRQLKACAAIALSVVGGGHKKALVFGYPGVGVRSFPQAAAYYLNKKCRQSFSFALASCEKLVYGTSENAINRFFDELVKTVKQASPIILQIDGIELVSPLSSYIDTFSRVQSSLNYVLRALLDLPLTDTLLVATAHNPSILDPTIVQRFTIPIYMEPTNREIIVEILHQHFGEKNAANIADGLVSFMKRFKFLVVSSELCRAIDEVKRSNAKIEDLPPDKIVDLLTSSISPCASEDRLKEYERLNSAFIKLSIERDLPYWVKIFEEKELKP